MLMLTVGCNTEREDPPAGGATEPSGFDCDGHVADPLRRWSEAGFDGALAYSSPADGLCTIDEATAFDIGSVTKTMTAAAVLSLVERSTIALDDTAGRWLPELAGPVAAVTVDQLLTHTAGLGEAHAPDEQPMSLAEALVTIDAQPLLFEPGADVSYSNSGYTLLAAIVERASGRPFRDELTAEVLTLPDGSVAGGFWTDGLPAGAPWALEGAGGVAMSVRQLHDWTVALASGEIISRESVDRMTEPRVESDGGSLTYGWVSLDAETLGAPGLVSVGGGGSSGHEVALFWLPEGEQVVVLASSSEGVRAEDLAPAVVPALVAGDEVPPPVASVTGDPADLVAREGRYVLDNGSSVEVTADGAHVTAAAGDGAALPVLFPAPADLGADAVAEHERMVGDLMDGTATTGHEEIDRMKAELGASSWRLLGTGYIDRELRTYVGLTTGDGTVDAWLALDELGGIAGIEYEAAPPSRRLVQVAEATFVPAETIEGDDPEVTLTFAPASGGDGLTVSSESSTVTAARE